MNPDQVKHLALKYIEGTASEEEIRQLHDWYDTVNAGDTEVVVVSNPQTNRQYGDQMLAMLKEMIAHETQNAPRENVRTIPVYKRKWVRIAATIALLCSLGVWVYYFFANQTNNNTKLLQPKIETASANDMPPGGNKAVLFLANGTKIILDSVQNGTVARQGKTTIIKLNNGQLAYNELSEKPTEILYNTITTPKGGQYEIILADGTHVWLNAASSLRFPVLFVGKTREVQLTGEGYFEVAKNAAMPFHVTVAGMQVEVLGTHFNVMAYDDEPAIKTTLLEGSVKVTQRNKSVLLKPGEQAQLTRRDELKLLADADTEEAMGWKNGFLKYNHADLPAIMRQAARWYDVEVVYEGKIPGDRFSGKISRSVNLSQWLRVLELSNVHFKIEGKKLIVQP